MLRECLAHVHKDIVDCWNLRNGDQVGEFWKVTLKQVIMHIQILNSLDFKQLMLYLVQDVLQESSPTEYVLTIEKGWIAFQLFFVDLQISLGFLSSLLW